MGSRCGTTEWEVGKWVVSGNKGLTKEGVLMVFAWMFVCLVHSTSESYVLN